MEKLTYLLNSTRANWFCHFKKSIFLIIFVCNSSVDGVHHMSVLMAIFQLRFCSDLLTMECLLMLRLMELTDLISAELIQYKYRTN